MTASNPSTSAPNTTPRAEAPRPAGRARVLFADAGRLARGPIGAAVRQRFDIREVGDAEAAWQAVLLDASIRAAVVDLSTPAARAVELVMRLRSSKVQRIREIPVVGIVERSGDREGERLAAVEGTELLCEEIQGDDLAKALVLRLRVLVELSTTRDALQESRTTLDSVRSVDPETDLLTPAAFDLQVEKLVSYARRALTDLAVICIRVEFNTPGVNPGGEAEFEQRMRMVGRALSAAVRLEDLAARTDKAEFCVATPNDGMTDMLRFAARLRKVLENVDAAGPGVEVWTCIGVATLSEELRRNAVDLRLHAQRRAQMAQTSRSRRIMLGTTDGTKAPGTDPRGESGTMDVGLALALINSGRSAEVVPHLPQLLLYLNPLIRLIRQQQKLAAPRPEGEGAAKS